MTAPRWNPNVRTKFKGWIELFWVSETDDSCPTSPVSINAPSKSEYILGTTKQILEILRAAAGLAPIPLVKDLLEVGIQIISIGEAFKDVKDQVQDLNNRVAEFLLVVVKVTTDVQTPPEDLLNDTLTLKICLEGILTKLDQIRAQNKLLTALVPQVSKKRIEECATRFQEAVMHFQVLRDIHTTLDLGNIQNQLASIHTATKIVKNVVSDIQVNVLGVKESLQTIETILNNQQSTIRSPSLSFITPQPPRIFVGRDAFVDRLVSQLTSQDPGIFRTCILGPGGSGKTSVASAIANHPAVQGRFTSGRLHWIPCISATSPPSFLFALAQTLGLASQESNGVLAWILQTLEESNAAHLFVLDNFETAWYASGEVRREMKEILGAIDALKNVAILVTMRSEITPIQHWSPEVLPNMELEDSKRIYSLINDDTCTLEDGDEALHTLLQSLGHLPYAVTLMATRAKASLSSPSELLSEWKETGTSMLTTLEEGIEQSIQLSLLSNVVTRSPGALHVLQVLSMLPTGVDRDDLSIWIKNWKTESLDALRNTALLQSSVTTIPISGPATEGNPALKKKYHLSILPVVQSYMAQDTRIPIAVRAEVHQACFTFLAKLRLAIESPNHPEFKAAFGAIHKQDANLRAVLTPLIHFERSLERPTATDIARWSVMLESVLPFVWYLNWLSTPDLRSILYPLLCLSLRAQNKRCEAEIAYVIFTNGGSDIGCYSSLLRITPIFRDLGDMRRAVVSEFSAIYAWGRGAYGSQRPNWADGIISMVEEAREKWREYACENKEIQAQVLFGSGRVKVLFPMQLEAVALEELEEARKTFGELGSSDHHEVVGHYDYEIAVCNVLLARAYGIQRRFSDSVNASSAALTTFKSLSYGEAGMAPLISTACTFKSLALKLLDRWEDPEVMELLTLGLRIHNVLGDFQKLGQTLAGIGDVYAKRKMWGEARKCYEGAVKNGRLHLKYVPDDKVSIYKAGKWEGNLEYIIAMETTGECDDDKWYSVFF